jgi:hypothetical protein
MWKNFITLVDRNTLVCMVGWVLFFGCAASHDMWGFSIAAFMVASDGLARSIMVADAAGAKSKPEPINLTLHLHVEPE